jgi:coenzyme Q-binding protein COQ10
MPSHAEQRVLPYSPEQIFDLVADVERYPEFLPWCVASRINRRDGNVFEADVMIGFKMIREKFTSRVTLSRPADIQVEYTDGPFKYLTNHWKFIPADGGCLIDFHIDFEFRSRILQRVLEPLFTEAVHRMVSAFETRAGVIYGSSACSATIRSATSTAASRTPVRSPGNT